MPPARPVPRDSRGEPPDGRAALPWPGFFLRRIPNMAHDARSLAYVTGLANMRDFIPFPRGLKNRHQIAAA
jgi:hypothetical protein